MPFEKNTILYIDDDPEDHEILSMMVGDIAPRLKVSCFESSSYALEELMKLKPPDILPCLIILDLNMPILNGKVLFEKLRKEPSLRGIPIAIFSAGRNPADIQFFLDHGIPYYTKPTETSEMKKIVSRFAELC